MFVFFRQGVALFGRPRSLSRGESDMKDKLIFAIDPGSVRAGWCVVKPQGELVEGGVILPENFKASNDIRIADMCEDLRELLLEWEPRVILLEWVSGHVGRRRHKGSGAGLTVYGVSVGALWWVILTWKKSLPAKRQLEIEVVLIDETIWTGQVHKLDRALAIGEMFPRYNIKKDPGQDLADAIGLCVWYIRDCKIRSGKFDVG